MRAPYINIAVNCSAAQSCSELLSVVRFALGLVKNNISYCILKLSIF